MRIAIGEDLPVALNRKFLPGQTLELELDLYRQTDLPRESNAPGEESTAPTVAAAVPEHPVGPVQPQRRSVPAARFTLPKATVETTPLARNWTASFQDQRAVVINS